MWLSRSALRADSAVFMPDSTISSKFSETRQPSYRESLEQAISNPHLGQAMRRQAPYCSVCDGRADLKRALMKPGRQPVALGTVAWLSRKVSLPGWSIAHHQIELNDGAFGHPGVPFDVSPCGHLYLVAPVTSFSGRNIQDKYPNPSEATRDNKYWEYLAIAGARASNDFGELATINGKQPDKKSYIHLDGFYWIEMRNLGDHNGNVSILTSGALRTLQLASTAAESHRQVNGILPFHLRRPSLPTPSPSPPPSCPPSRPSSRSSSRSSSRPSSPPSSCPFSRDRSSFNQHMATQPLKIAPQPRLPVQTTGLWLPGGAYCTPPPSPPAGFDCAWGWQ